MKIVYKTHMEEICTGNFSSIFGVEKKGIKKLYSRVKFYLHGKSYSSSESKRGRR